MALHITQDVSLPTLKILVDVIAHPMGGANPDLALSLAGNILFTCICYIGPSFVLFQSLFSRPIKVGVA